MLTFLFCLSLLVGMVWLFFFYTDRSYVYSYASLSFKELRLIYSINPDSLYLTSIQGLIIYSKLSKKDDYYLRISPLAYLWLTAKYHINKKQIQNTRNLEYRKKALTIILEDCQTKIDKMKSEAEDQIREAERITRRVEESLKG